MHSADAPPSSANVSYNPYDTLAGFLTSFSAQMKAALLDTTVTVAKATVDGAGSETVTSKIFLLSKAEVGLGAENGITEGTLLALFNANNTSRVATPTAAAVSNSNYTSTSLKEGAGWHWWLRSPYAANSSNVRHVSADGSKTSSDACNGYIGLRPALNLPSNILVSDSVGSDGAYTIVWNQPPSTPPNISVPSTIKSGSSATISWGASIDPDGDTMTYELQCSVNGGSYSDIYTGPLLSYAHAITTAMNTVQYRVRAKDSVGNYSAYQTGLQVTVLHNVAPGISGVDVDLGLITAPPSTSFVVTDTDPGDTVIVDVTLDGSSIQQINPVVLGQSYTVELTEAQFYGLANGQHTLRITASDTLGDSTTRTTTFTRGVSTIDFAVNPIATDAMPEKILISFQYYADPQNVTVLVSNNALDDSPTWEAATQGLKHIFSNSTKTADSWAIGVRIIITPTQAFPDITCAAPIGSYI